MRVDPAVAPRYEKRRGAFCVGCCWALVLVFAAGVARLLWMAALTALMIPVTTRLPGARAGPVAGMALLAAASVVLAYGAASAGAKVGDTVLVSRATGEQGAKARGQFYGGSAGFLSADGRYVAFVSDARNLDPADTDTGLDVYVRDLRSGLTTLVSRADGADGAKGNGETSVGDSLKAGRFLAISSFATNLDPADPDAIRDVYVRDLESHENRLVSRADGPDGAKGNAESARGRLSADGTVVVFQSNASNLDPGDTDATTDLFLRDIRTDETTLLTPEPERVELAALSEDGRRVAYIRAAVEEAEGGIFGDLYVMDLTTGQRSLASRADGANGNVANGPARAGGVSLSADGRHVAFSSRATNLDRADTDPIEDVYVRDTEEGVTTLVSRADGFGGPKANGESLYGGSLSADGRYVAFSSAGWNLHPLDTLTDGGSDVFVRDLRTGNTALASRSASGAKGNDSSLSQSLSSDSRYLAFATRARNFDPTDADYRYDVYVRDLRAPLPLPGRRPRSRILAIHRGGMVVGRASDDGEVQIVEVSLTRRLRGQRTCQAWNGFWHRSPSFRGGGCRPRFLLAAHFTRRWLRGSPLGRSEGTYHAQRGVYEITSRAIDTAGQRERVFSARKGNVRTIRVTAFGNVSRARASTQFASFLAKDYAGMLPRPWRLRVATGTFLRGSGSANGSRVKPAR